MEQFAISLGLRCGDSQECFHLPFFAAIKEIITLTSCELLLRSANRFAMTVVVHSIDNNAVGHLTRGLSCFLWHFLTHGEEIEMTQRRWHSPLVQGRLKILYYVMLLGKKLVARARNIIVGENTTCPFSRLEWLFISEICSFHELERLW